MNIELTEKQYNWITALVLAKIGKCTETIDIGFEAGASIIVAAELTEVLDTLIKQK